MNLIKKRSTGCLEKVNSGTTKIREYPLLIPRLGRREGRREGRWDRCTDNLHRCYLMKNTKDAVNEQIS